ncbi:hypothetical protein HD554DRAFT_128409 [Boletus coccyginus]|nr:hypothetical protein HD554DRAFT_128409 [Boletus coccyginus]
MLTPMSIDWHQLHGRASCAYDRDRSVDDSIHVKLWLCGCTITYNSKPALILTHIHTMAKSLRSKSKRSFRSKKRESGKYAVAEAARLNRLNAKLAVVKEKDRPRVAPLDTAEELVAEDQPQGAVSNVVKDGGDVC